jgi:hypothetical protein
MVWFDGLFENVTSVSFRNSNVGDIRIDDIDLTRPAPAPIPLPAAGWLLLAGLGGLVIWGRSLKAA